MSAETRFFPRTTFTRKVALTTAKNKNDSLNGASPLSQKTIDRLNAICPLLEERLIELSIATVQMASQAVAKTAAKNNTVLFCSHFIQVFDLCVKRGEYKPSDRLYYGLSAETNKLPRMIQDTEILLAAERVIKGETNRIAAGGAPMSRPSIAEVQAAYTTFKTVFLNMSNCHSRHRIKQKAVNELTKEVRGVITKVWAEVETFYDELPRESIRNHGRLWGIVYNRKGGEKLVEGTITHALTGLPLAGAKIKLLNGRNKTSTTAEGKFKLNTTLMHQQAIKLSCAGYADIELMIDLTEGKNTVCNLAMQPVG